MLRELLKDIELYMEVGGWVMPPLIAATVLLWFGIGYRIAVLGRQPRRSVRSLIRRYARTPPRAPRSVVEKAVVQALDVARSGPGHLRRFLDDALAEHKRDIRRFGRLINTIVAVAPILGLLGTVIGMIETFESLGDMSLFSQSGGIARGISQALFTTQLGLAVAIPGLVVNGVLDKRQKMVDMELAQIKDILCSDPDVAAREEA